jgi:hypothetical protein
VRLSVSASCLSLFCRCPLRKHHGKPEVEPIVTFLFADYSSRVVGFRCAPVNADILVVTCAGLPPIIANDCELGCPMKSDSYRNAKRRSIFLNQPSNRSFNWCSVVLDELSVFLSRQRVVQRLEECIFAYETSGVFLPRIQDLCLPHLVQRFTLF